jgi:SAM-dependent methyltransferase
VAGHPGHRPGRAVGPSLNANRWLSSGSWDGEDYDRRLAESSTTGPDRHGEASFVEALGAATVLDAGCGTGRVAIELHQRGIEVVGVDLDPGMLASARRKQPELAWVEADLATVVLDRRFDAVVMAGNVMIFLTPGSEATVVANMARHLVDGGALVAGFQLLPGGLDLATYDRLAAAAGLRLVERWATWERAPWSPTGDYAVSVPVLGGLGTRIVRPPAQLDLQDADQASLLGDQLVRLPDHLVHRVGPPSITRSITRPFGASEGRTRWVLRSCGSKRSQGFGPRGRRLGDTHRRSSSRCPAGTGCRSSATGIEVLS